MNDAAAITPAGPRIVAIGASAGGIEAFRQFFEAMPADSGMGFVVVLHLSADRKSQLAEIIGRWTSMPVTEAAHDDPVGIDRVSVIPPGHIATMAGGRIRLRRLAPDVAREAAPIDTFFDSLAADQGARAVGIVLSGTGHDGALGLKAIKARGGLTLVQGADGTSPQHTGMPDSAIATGAVDLIVPVQDMPGLLVRAKTPLAIETVAGEAPTDVDAARLLICDVLRIRLGHDFSQYKDKTFLRRVARRMQVLGLDGLDDYVLRLQDDRGEAMLLFRDLLIGVTTFFRDADAFEAVKRVVIPRLFEGKAATDTVRVWVPGCATGEEAYSLAMLLSEHMDGLAVVPRVQVFATDIDDAAIGTARAGRYPGTLLDGLSDDRRARFFTASESGYVVTKEIRDLCTFSAHSLVRDPPFSRMNLVSCRNLLIYMDAGLQATVIPSFHYALLPGGILMLGSSETVGRHDTLFAPLEKPHRIFARRDGPTPSVPMLQRFTPNRTRGTAEDAPVDPAGGRSRTTWPKTIGVANARVLERFAAPFVVVARDGTMVHYSSHVGHFLQPALGPPSDNVFEMVRPDLRHALRQALQEAHDSGRPAEQTVPVRADGGAGGSVQIIVEPLPGRGTDAPYLVVFQAIGDARGAEGAVAVPPLPPALPLAADADLHREIRDTRERLQALTEEHETALEELRSANEELHSVNEELQSSNEELETSKEEIQAVNEELQTVNAELSGKVDELDRANSDLRNLFESTRVATVFLDQHLVIRAYTPEVGSIYNLIPSDRGRPLTDIVGRIAYDTLREDVGEVLHTLEPLERRVSRIDDTAHYLLRILPYRTPDSTVDGSLVTFVDVTRIVEAEKHQRLLVDELNHRVKNMLAVVLSLASQTVRRSETLEDFSRVFTGRVHALTAAYTLLSREQWSSVRLDQIIREEMHPFLAPDRANIQIEGPPVALSPRGALALGMAIHELATNAVKYGALSVPAGDVLVTWRVERTADADELALDWIERNGPPVTPPARRGFGTTLIERSLAHDLGGKARLAFDPDGVKAHIRAPLEAAPEGSPPLVLGDG